MHVLDAAIELSGKHELQTSLRTEATLRIDVPRPAPTDRVTLSGAGPGRVHGRDDGDEALSDSQSLELLTAKKLLERLLGKRVRVVDPRAFQVDERGQAQRNAAAFAPPPGPGGSRASIDFQTSRRFEEQESTAFSATGVVKTSDGKEIEIDLAVSLSRSFVAENQTRLHIGPELKDPLVINFDRPAAGLSSDTFQFDIDSDATPDQLRFAAAGSGFLALDKNGDGTINDGGELFGPRTGDGFDELAVHDSDGNGFIDDADPIYRNLRIWTRDASGEDRLLALGQQGVGAIYLGHVSTPFSINDEANQTQAQVRTSGVFIGEEGKVGTVQQLDLAV